VLIVLITVLYHFIAFDSLRTISIAMGGPTQRMGIARCILWPVVCLSIIWTVYCVNADELLIKQSTL